MSEIDNQNKEEAVVDFSEDPTKPIEDELRDLDNLADNINSQSAAEMEEVKRLAEEVWSLFSL